MPILSKPAFAAKTALYFVTIGALVEVWAGVWWYYLKQEGAHSSGPWYICTGVLLSGLVLIVIGLLAGPIGRMARHAEMPPAEVLNATAQAEQLAAANPPPVVPGAGTAAVGVPAAPGVAANPMAPMTSPVAQTVASAPAPRTTATR